MDLQQRVSKARAALQAVAFQGSAAETVAAAEELRQAQNAAKTHTDPADGLTVHGGSADCEHQFEPWLGEDGDENEIEPPMDVCTQCGGIKH
jgi:hypothetical protein